MTAISIIAEVNTLFWQMLLVFFLISALLASTNLRKANAVPIVYEETTITASDLKSTLHKSFHPHRSLTSCTSSVISIRDTRTDQLVAEDNYQQNYILIKETLEVVVAPNTPKVANKTKIFGALMASETLQRQVLIANAKHQKTYGQILTMISKKPGTDSVPLGTLVSRTAREESRANKFGETSQPLINHQTKPSSSRPYSTWSIVRPLQSDRDITSRR